MCEVNKILTNPHCGYSSRWFMSLDDFCDLAVQAACNLGSHNHNKILAFKFFSNLCIDIKRRIFDRWGFGPNLKKLPTKG